MEKEKIVLFLTKFNYSLTEKSDGITVKLGLGQIVKIELAESD